jgi:undecaprenyl diphosphate synthase
VSERGNLEGSFAQPPGHVAIIMDGNGRWAKARGLNRSDGHRAGVQAARSIVEAARDYGIQTLTLYSFSTENWRRPRREVELLLQLLHGFVRDDLDTLIRNGVRVRIIGSREGLDHSLVKVIDEAEAKSASNSRFRLNIAFNYGSRDEILRATRALVDKCLRGEMSISAIDEPVFEMALDTHGLASPDLIIRTSGEYRLSNFLLWQAAYSELVFSDVLWPDFCRNELGLALEEYARRERRFGAVSDRSARSETDIAQ